MDADSIVVFDTRGGVEVTTKQLLEAGFSWDEIILAAGVTDEEFIAMYCDDNFGI